MAGILLFASAPTTPSVQSFSALKIGGGGQISGFTNSLDVGGTTETLGLRTDTYGAYKFNPNGSPPTGNNGATGAWQQLINNTAMPPLFVVNGAAANNGVYSFEIAPSNSLIMYMVYFTYPSANPNTFSGIYKSTDAGATWTQTAFTPLIDTLAPANGLDRLCGQKLSIKTNDPSIVFAGFEDTGKLWATADGGSTWGNPSGFPTTSGRPGITGIVFNPNNPNQAYACSGGNGVYVSNNANLGPSSTWSLVTSSPTLVRNACFAPNGGKVYFCKCTIPGGSAAGAGDVVSYNGSSFTTEVSASCVGVAVDPGNSSHVVVADINNNLNENVGSGWSGFTSVITLTSPPDIPWQNNVPLGINEITFSKVTANKIYANCFQGFWYTTSLGSITTGTTINWTSMAVGEEQLVVNTMATPNSGSVIVGSWDFPLLVCNTTQYPTGPDPINDGFLSACWSLDNAKFTNTSFCVAICDPVFSGYNNGTNGCKSCYSTTGAPGSWTRFALTHGATPSIPTNAFNGSTGNGGGDVAVSTPTNFLWAAAGGTTPQFTTNAGVDWTTITVSGSPSFASFRPQLNGGQRVIAADSAVANAFWLYFDGNGLYRSTNSGANFSKTSGTPPTGMNIILQPPGQAGHLFLFGGFQQGGAAGVTTGGFRLAPYLPGLGSPTWPLANQGMYYTADTGGTFNQIPNARFSSFCFGAVAPGQSYPAAYGLGYVCYTTTDTRTISGSGTVTFTVGTGLSNTFAVGAPIGANPFANAMMCGVVQSYNSGTGVVTIAVNGSVGSGSSSNWLIMAYGIWECSSDFPSTTPVWKQIGPWTTANTFDQPRWAVADPSIYGQVYFGFGGSSVAVRK